MSPADAALLDGLYALRNELRAAGIEARQASVHPERRASLVNMAQFVALRSADRRGVQEELARRGLSSLGRCEPHVAATVTAVLSALASLSGAPGARPDPVALDPDEPGFDEGLAELDHHTDRLLGRAPTGRRSRIMVTLPSEAAGDPVLVERLVEAGMDVARINCAHDEASAWRAMAGHVRRAADARRRPMRILMDLGGPKLRTGPIPDEPGVMKLKPRRDRLGAVAEPAFAVLVAEPAAAAARARSHLPVVPLASGPLTELVVGDHLRLCDARGSSRRLEVHAVGPLGPIVRATKTTYLVEGLELAGHGFSGRVGSLPPQRGALHLSIGDRLLLTPDLAPARHTAGSGAPRLGCTLPEALGATRPGHRVLFDDGRFTGVVQASNHETDGTLVEITGAPLGGGKLRAEKGINLPDTDIPVDAFTPKDRADLGAVVELADLVALSFVRNARDVEQFLPELRAAGGDDLGLVLKIETVQAFGNLPDLLTAALVHRDVGVMIARGDLAVEAGYLRLAEMQEEMLWLCEAAHVPAIWATDVLDTMARTGRPSRSEITDAAMSDRAECVMLNKGPFIVEAVEALDDVLRRMTTLQAKKRPLLRELRSWSSARST